MQRISRSIYLSVWIAVLFAAQLAGPAYSLAQNRACRSVHLWFPSAEATGYYNELTVEKSASGTYFMACGFSKGYFGIQELANGKKIVLFSVWEPGKQNNPNTTPEERRVKELAAGKDVRVKRFGGEGTGGQSFYDYDWKVGQACRFVVYAKPDGDNRTQYSGYFYIPEEDRWQHMATFSTLADGHLLRGLYSFVEDFRRNGESTKHVRRCQIGNGWALVGKQWNALNDSRFTADSTETNNIDAGISAERFFLTTGGDTENKTTPLRESISQKKLERKPPLDLPDAFSDGRVSQRRLRILSYNIKHGRGNDNKVDLERTASVIRRLNPDVVALQEVDNTCKRSGSVDQPAKLSTLTALRRNQFSSFFDYDGGKYGMAMLSRYPLAIEKDLRLPDGAEPRTSLIGRITLPEGGSLIVSDVHFYRTEEERLAQAETLLNYLKSVDGSTVVVGDFNSQPGSKVLELFQDEFEIPSKGDDAFTFSADKPDREIDFSMLRKTTAWEIESIDAITEPIASDHRPLVLEIKQLKK